MFLYLSGTGAESVHSLPALSGTITGITSGSISTTMCGSRSTDTTNVTPLMPMTTSHTPSTSPLMAQSHSVSTGTSLVAQGLLSNPTSSATTTAIAVGSPSTHTTYAGLQIQPAEQPFHPDPSFVFPKRPFGKTNDVLAMHGCHGCTLSLGHGCHTIFQEMLYFAICVLHLFKLTK